MRSKPLVCVVDSADSPISIDVTLEQGVLGEAAEVIPVPQDGDADPTAEMREAEGIIVGHFPHFSRRSMERFDRARVIVRIGVGYDNVDIEAAAERGIPICNVPDYGTEEVADHAILFTLALIRKLQPALRNVREGGWAWQAAAPCRRLRGQTFGVVGCGRIGTAAALRAKAMGFTVQFYDPYVPSGYHKAIGVPRVPTLRALLETSDVVSLHTPLTAETRGMIGDAEFALMKTGAVIVNTARGPVIEERALLEALGSGHIAGAGLDLVENEPVFNRELLNHPNCLITPHMAFYSVEGLKEMRETAAGIILRVLNGEAPINVVNGVTSRRVLAEGR
jgi:C-terminal binding protein